MKSEVRNQKELLPLICFLSILGCASKGPEWIERIKDGDYGIVSLGTYPYTTSQIRYKPQEFAELRKEIEVGNSLLSHIVRHFYPEECDTSLHFRYKFAAKDGDIYILRYFARIKPRGKKRFAGYSLQFVFEDGALQKIYLFKTPLERR